ncbi:hypothetical protein V5O48_016524, partial [Marasmius crinis-equi]
MPVSSATSMRSAASSGPSEPTTVNVTEPLYQVKLLSALRSGDPALIHPFLNEISKDKRKSTDGDLDTGAAALHLAIRCASVDTIRLLLSHRAISPNGVYPTGSGTTPLHLAASLGRVDVVNLLLEQDGINDALQDSKGRTCKEVAKGKEVVHAIENSREFLNASYRSILHSYIMSPPSSPPSPSLLNLLQSPRVRFVDLSYLDDDTGTSLLHEAAKRKDLRLIELAVRAGADVFVRDRRGKVAYEGTGKDDSTRVFLRQFANHDTTLIQTRTITEPQTLKGYLNKYTNVAKGYNTRWFVLKDGILSYYRHQEDETIASRGSISMKTAILKLPYGRTDKLQFEVHSMPSKGHSSVQKWYMKANHPVEAARWAQAIGKSIEWYKREGNSPRPDGGDAGPSRGTVSPSGTNSEGHSPNPSHQHSPSIGSSSLLSFGGKSTISVPSMDSARQSLSGLSIKRAVSKGKSAFSSTEMVQAAPAPEDTSTGALTDDRASPDSGAFDNDERDQDQESMDDGASSAKSIKSIPHSDGFELHGNATAAQIELTAQMLSNAIRDGAMAQNKGVDALQESYNMVQGMITEYMQMVKEREDWYKHKLDAERQRQRAWEESLATVVKEGEMLENELRMRSRKRGSRFFDSSSPSTFAEGMNTLKARQRSMLAGRIASGEATDRAGSLSPRGSFFKPLVQSPGIEGLPESVETPTQETVVAATQALDAAAAGVDVDEDIDDTEDEDEFFDAIEANTLPNLVVPEQLKSPTHSPEESVLSKELTLSFVGYQNLRKKLEVIAERPPTSLWSVLKHSIGKDLTKISFPVFFNEPT